MQIEWQNKTILEGRKRHTVGRRAEDKETREANARFRERWSREEGGRNVRSDWDQLSELHDRYLFRLGQVRNLANDWLELPVHQCNLNIIVNQNHPRLADILLLLLHTEHLLVQGRSSPYVCHSAAGKGCDTWAPCWYRTGCCCGGRLSGNEKDRFGWEFTLGPGAMFVR